MTTQPSYSVYQGFSLWTKNGVYIFKWFQKNKMLYFMTHGND